MRIETFHRPAEQNWWKNTSAGMWWSYWSPPVTQQLLCQRIRFLAFQTHFAALWVLRQSRASFSAQHLFSIRSRNMLSITMFASSCLYRSQKKAFFLLVLSMNISRPHCSTLRADLPDRVIISGNLLTGEGAAGAVGGGQEIRDSLYGAVNYHRASQCHYMMW